MPITALAPIEKAEVSRVATPSISGLLPRSVPGMAGLLPGSESVPTLMVALVFRKKVAVPVGVPAPGAEAPTVNVRGSLWSNALGLGLAVRVAVVSAVVTVTGALGEVLPAKPESPS